MAIWCTKIQNVPRVPIDTDLAAAPDELVDVEFRDRLLASGIRVLSTVMSDGSEVLVFCYLGTVIGDWSPADEAAAIPYARNEPPVVFEGCDTARQAWLKIKRYWTLIGLQIGAPRMEA